MPDNYGNMIGENVQLNGNNSIAAGEYAQATTISNYGKEVPPVQKSTPPEGKDPGNAQQQPVPPKKEGVNPPYAEFTGSVGEQGGVIITGGTYSGSSIQSSEEGVVINGKNVLPGEYVDEKIPGTPKQPEEESAPKEKEPPASQSGGTANEQVQSNIKGDSGSVAGGFFTWLSGAVGGWVAEKFSGMIGKLDNPEQRYAESGGEQQTRPRTQRDDFLKEEAARNTYKSISDITGINVSNVGEMYHTLQDTGSPSPQNFGIKPRNVQRGL